MLDFDKLQYSLQSLGANAEAAETHGTLCGLLMETAPMSTWIGFTLEELPDSNDVLAHDTCIFSSSVTTKRWRHSIMKKWDRPAVTG